MRIASLRPLAALSALSLAAAGLAVTATSASADLVTHCSGEAEGVTVPGDLVVPAGSACVLNGVTIEGQARVMAGADLIVSDTTINGAVFVNGDGYFDAGNSRMQENVTNRAAYGVYLESSSVGGGFFGRTTESGDNTFVYAHDTVFEGRVQVEQGEVILQSANVSGHVDITDVSFVDVVDSTLERTLSVSAAESGSRVSASEIDGATTYTGNSGPIELGTDEDTNYFGSDITVSDNSGGVEVTGNIIRGNLEGVGNDPAPTGSENRVRGEQGGQFTELEPSASSAALLHSEQSRDESALDERSERRGRALDMTEELGAANL